MSALRRFLDPETVSDIARLAGIIVIAFMAGALFTYGVQS